MNLPDRERRATGKGSALMATKARVDRRRRADAHLADALVHPDLLARLFLLRHGPNLALCEREDPALLVLCGDLGLDERELLARADELELDLLEYLR